MQLKRLYDHEAPRDDWRTRRRQCPGCRGQGVVINETRDGVDPCPNECESGVLAELVPPIKGIQILHAGDRQNFSTGFVEGALGEGWLEIGGGQIRVLGDPPAIYRILRGPGWYCCHCDEPVEADQAGRYPDEQLGAVHVEEAHPDTPSPDPNNPAGYRHDLFYACLLETPKVQKMSAEKAAAHERGLRDAVHDRIREKYGDTRGDAERRRAAKGGSDG